MFVQVIHGQVADEETLRAALTRWESQLGPTAEGWLGTTAGVTSDGRGVAVVRFESEQAARHNSERPEQGEWWAEAERAFSGPVVFQDSTYVDLDMRDRDPSSAGFVQVMQGQGTNHDRAREIMAQDSDAWAQWRPDVIASVTAGHADGAFTLVNYFISEAAAREGEQKPPPAELMERMEELSSLMTGEPTFFDLTDPWYAAPSDG